MAMIDAFRDVCPRDKPWPITGLAAVGAVFAFVYQVLPLLVLVDMPRQAAIGVVFIVPACAAIFAAGVGYSHNKKLQDFPPSRSGVA